MITMLDSVLHQISDVRSGLSSFKDVMSFPQYPAMYQSDQKGTYFTAVLDTSLSLNITFMKYLAFLISALRSCSVLRNKVI